MYFHRKHKNNKRRQCAYGCIKAYNVLDKPEQYSDLKELFETLDSHEERYFYSVSMSRIMFPQALDKWTNSHPDSGDALLVMVLVYYNGLGLQGAMVVELKYQKLNGKSFSDDWIKLGKYY